MTIKQNELRKHARNFILKKYYCDIDQDEIITESESENYITDESGKPQKFFIRLNVGKLLSDLNVRMDAETGEILNWCFSDLYKNASDTILTMEEALRIASEYIKIPSEAVIEEFFQETEENSHITNITWRHLVNGLDVDNDSIKIQINSKTKQVISVIKIWNDVSEIVDKIDINDAIKIAEKEAPRYTSGDEYSINEPEQKYIPVVLQNSDGEPYMNILKVWQVYIREPARKFPPTTTLNIDCITGEIVRVEHSK